MKFLLDQGLPRSAVAEIIVGGHDAEHVGNIGMASATDDEILAEAIRQESVVVTLDADFHTLLAKSAVATPSVIRLRLQGLKGPDVAAVVLQVALVAEVELSAGAAVSVTANGIRIRLLPLP